MQSEKHFSRRQRALCHRKNGIFENLGGGLATLPPRFLRPWLIASLFSLSARPSLVYSRWRPRPWSIYPVSKVLLLLLRVRLIFDLGKKVNSHKELIIISKIAKFGYEML